MYLSNWNIILKFLVYGLTIVFPIYGLPDHEIEPRIENWNPSHHVLDKKYERFIGNKSKFYLPLEIRVRLAQSCIHIFDISNRTYRYRYHL